MALNYPGPFELRFFYTVTIGGLALTHQHRMNIDVAGTVVPGTAFADIDAVQKNTVVVGLDTAVSTYAALLQPFFDDGVTTLDYVELWEYEPLSFEAQFISVQNLGLLGTSVSTVVSTQESRFTFRALGGGSLMVVLAETVMSDKSAPIGYSVLNVQEKALVDWYLGATSIALARDTTYVAGFNKLFRGTNEATFKRRFR